MFSSFSKSTPELHLHWSQIYRDLVSDQFVAMTTLHQCCSLLKPIWPMVFPGNDSSISNAFPNYHCLDLPSLSVIAMSETWATQVQFLDSIRWLYCDALTNSVSDVPAMSAACSHHVCFSAIKLTKHPLVRWWYPYFPILTFPFCRVKKLLQILLFPVDVVDAEVRIVFTTPGTPGTPGTPKPPQCW